MSSRDFPFVAPPTHLSQREFLPPLRGGNFGFFIRLFPYPAIPPYHVKTHHIRGTGTAPAQHPSVDYTTRTQPPHFPDTCTRASIILCAPPCYCAARFARCSQIEYKTFRHAQLSLPIMLRHYTSQRPPRDILRRSRRRPPRFHKKSGVSFLYKFLLKEAHHRPESSNLKQLP